MIEKAAATIPIESFMLIRNEAAATDTLVYMDPHGRPTQREVPKVVVDQAMEALDGVPRAIPRSSGGLTNAQPCQLVLYHPLCEYSQKQLEIRVKLRLTDFRNTANNRNGGTFSLLTKHVLPGELHNPFPYSIDGNQNFAIDFGRGPVPVYVFALISGPARERSALFVDRCMLERLVRATIPSKVIIDRYRAPRDALRYYPRTVVDPALSAIPPSLKIAVPLEMRAGISLDTARQILRQSVQTELHASVAPTDHNAIELESYTVETPRPCNACITSDVVLYMEPA